LDYAEKMISISDNTATDHLLYLLGRENVEAMLPQMGHAEPQLNIPFLGTLEMFKLKWGIKPQQTAEYLTSTSDQKRATLDYLKQVPRDAVGTNGISFEQPTLIDQLEWFATTEENCAAMFWLSSQNSPQIRQVLSKNVLFVKTGSSGHWRYAGFKGGSEPGVINATFLLESASGQSACLAMTWNNTKQNLSQNRFFDLVQKTLKFAERQIP
jgi:hypothetical protein